MLKEMLNADTIFDFALFESGINELLTETNHIDLYMRATDFQAALNVASLTDRLDSLFENIGCVEIDLMVYNVSYEYYKDTSDDSCIIAMKRAVQECYDFYKKNYEPFRVRQIMIHRECVCCGGTVYTAVPYSSSAESHEMINSDCECGCSLQLCVVDITG